MNILLLILQPLFVGSTELLLIGGIAFLLFGGKKFPEMMRGIGQGIREFKKGVNDTNSDFSRKNEHRNTNEECLNPEESQAKEQCDSYLKKE